MRRREFLGVVGGAAVGWPLAARGQQPAMPVIGFLAGGSAWELAHLAAAFRRGLSEAGYVEGRNVVVEYRWAEGHYDRLPILAADLVRRQVAVIFAWGSPAVLVAKAATATIPIIFQIGVDPVQLGLVASLNRPGGNLTGVLTLAGELWPKRLELLHELVSTTKIFAVLINPANSVHDDQSRELQTTAHARGLQLHVLRATTERDFDPVFAMLVRLRAGALVIGSDGFFNGRSGQLAELTIRHAIPAVYQYREFAAAGGLVSYGGSIADTLRWAGVYTGRILKGEKPAELPVQQSTKAEMFINLKTAKALGINVPLPLLGRADEVIE
jgi:ABC-type uncharacterized transport system substrate-binding protein